MDSQLTISTNSFILLLIGAAVSWGVMMTTLMDMKRNIRDSLLEQKRINDDHEKRIRWLEGHHGAVSD